MVALILRRWSIVRLVIGSVALQAVIRVAVHEISPFAKQGTPRWPAVLVLVFLFAGLSLVFALCFLSPWLAHLPGLSVPRQRQFYARFLLWCGLGAFAIGALGLSHPPAFDNAAGFTGAAGLIFGSVAYLKRHNDGDQVG